MDKEKAEVLDNIFGMEKRKLCGDVREAFQYLKRSYRKEGNRLLGKVSGDRTRGNGFKLKEGRFRVGCREKFFYSEGSETLEQIVPKCGGYLIHGGFQDQAGLGPEQAALAAIVPIFLQENLQESQKIIFF